MEVSGQFKENYYCRIPNERHLERALLGSIDQRKAEMGGSVEMYLRAEGLLG
jgi:hypothetical protein